MMRGCAVFLLSVALVCATPVDDWNAIVAMDAGPASTPENVEQARQLAAAHMARHKVLIEDFLKKNPYSDRAFDARLRLAAILAATGKMEKKQSLVDESMLLLQKLERDKSAALTKRAEAGFRRVCLLMQSLQGQESARRGDLVAAARNYKVRYPGDRRAPRLLVEVATICDNDTALKRELLEEARNLSMEEGLNRRIADDLERLDLLNKPLPLRFPTLQNRAFDAASLRGRIIVLIFWSAESAPSLLWIEEFRRALEKLPGDRLAIVTISVDTDQNMVRERIKEIGIADWPTGCDGKGWLGPLIEPFGINAVPTVFLLDQQGVLRAINARNSYESWIRRLLIQPAGAS